MTTRANQGKSVVVVVEVVVVEVVVEVVVVVALVGTPYFNSASMNCTALTEPIARRLSIVASSDAIVAFT